jgi:hypothetical protein
MKEILYDGSTTGPTFGSDVIEFASMADRIV